MHFGLAVRNRPLPGTTGGKPGFGTVMVAATLRAGIFPIKSKRELP